MFISKIGLRIQMGDRSLRFTQSGSDFYSYEPKTKEEAEWLRSNSMYKSGLVWEDGAGEDAAAEPASEPVSSPAPAAAADDPWALVEVPEVRTNRQGIEWLMANKGERFKVLSRDGLVALAARHGVSFPNLNPKKK